MKLQRTSTEIIEQRVWGIWATGSIAEDWSRVGYYAVRTDEFTDVSEDCAVLVFGGEAVQKCFTECETWSGALLQINGRIWIVNGVLQTSAGLIVFPTAAFSNMKLIFRRVCRILKSDC